METLQALLGLAAALGIVQAIAGLLAVRRFAAGGAGAVGRPRDGITVLKPLHGDEPMLEEALASFCTQDYPDFQLVLGVQDTGDAALAVARRIRARFPTVDVTIVVDPTPHGKNRKIANLINMLPAARHDLLVISDSDVHAAPDCLTRLAAALGQPGTGVVTTLYAGLPSAGGLPARLGATQISHGFLPGALLARALGRQDCLGAVMALRRDTLARLGGLAALSNQLADDAVLGRLARAHGLDVRLAATVPLTTVGERSFAALWRHELRWARTIRSLEPLGFAASAIQYPLAWAILAMAVDDFDVWTLCLFALCWAVRALAARGIDRALGLTTRAPAWLLPLRDLLSMAVLLASYLDNQVEWRGQMMRATPPVLVQPVLVQPALQSEYLVP